MSIAERMANSLSEIAKDVNKSSKKSEYNNYGYNIVIIIFALMLALGIFGPIGCGILMS
jgi:hypothetical protein